MRNFRAIFVLFLGLLCVAVIDTGPARADNCKDGLADNSFYSCSAKNDDGSSVSFCIEVLTSNPTPGKFAITDGENLYQCTCQAKGNSDSPKFNESKDFLCGNLSNGNALIAKTASGGTKLKQGQFFCNDYCDVAGVFECVLDPTCIP